MSRIQIFGFLLLLLGSILYFFVEGDPYTIIAGFVGGIGLGAIIAGPKLSARYQK